LLEELNWEPQSFVKRVELRVAGELVAWFYHAVLDVGIEELRVARGCQARLVSCAELANLPVSPWHAAVLRAWLDGKSVVELDA
jgi:hypothetical protein